MGKNEKNVCQSQKVKALSLALSLETQGAVSYELKAAHSVDMGEAFDTTEAQGGLTRRHDRDARHDVAQGGESVKGQGGRVVANGCSSAQHAGGGREAGSSEGLCREDRVGVRVADEEVAAFPRDARNSVSVCALCS